MANEGKAVMGVRAASAGLVLDALRGHPLGRNAAVIGRCIGDAPEAPASRMRFRH